MVLHSNAEVPVLRSDVMGESQLQVKTHGAHQQLHSSRLLFNPAGAFVTWQL